MSTIENIIYLKTRKPEKPSNHIVSYNPLGYLVDFLIDCLKKES
jgi:hypothetical protein